MTNQTSLPSSTLSNCSDKAEQRSEREEQLDREQVQQIQQELRALAERVEDFREARLEVLSFQEHVVLGETGLRLSDCADLLSNVIQEA